MLIRSHKTLSFDIVIVLHLCGNGTQSNIQGFFSHQFSIILWYLQFFVLLLQVFEGILMISSLYVELCEAGEIGYLTWKRIFKCSMQVGRSEALLKDIEETCKKMEDELKEWRKTINDRRYHCYSLNHFTMKQILHLRKELAKACRGEVAMDELPLQIFMLLESVNRNINPLVLANVLRTVIPDCSVRLTEDGVKDEQEYFASDTVGESSMPESAEEEIDMAPPNKRRRMNSIETVKSAKETLEEMNYAEEYLLAALQDCGHHATEDEIVAWVVSSEHSQEDVMKLCKEAKKNPNLANLLEDVGVECYVVNNDERIATTFDR